MRKIFLSETLSKQEKTNVITTYIHSGINHVIAPLKEKLTEDVTEVLETEYTKRFGNSWKEIVQKYNIKTEDFSRITILASKKQYKTAITLFNPSYKYDGNTKFPFVEDDRKFWNPLINNRRYKNLVYQLEEIFDKKYEFFLELKKDENLFVEIFGRYSWDCSMECLPKIDTFEQLQKTYPHVFNIYMSELAKTYEEDVEVVDVGKETRELQKFLI